MFQGHVREEAEEGQEEGQPGRHPSSRCGQEPLGRGAVRAEAGARRAHHEGQSKRKPPK